MKRVDVFPAVVRLLPPDPFLLLEKIDPLGPFPQGTRKVDRTRVAVVRDLVLIARDSPEGPQLVFREKVVEQFHRDKYSYIRTDSGKILVLTKDDNCGCGSRLRSWNPYGNIVSSSEDPVG